MAEPEPAKIRSIQHPVSLHVETISPLPVVRDLPPETELTVNLRFSPAKAKEMALHLLERVIADDGAEIFVTLTGVSK